MGAKSGSPALGSTGGRAQRYPARFHAAAEPSLTRLWRRLQRCRTMAWSCSGTVLVLSLVADAPPEDKQVWCARLRQRLRADAFKDAGKAVFRNGINFALTLEVSAAAEGFRWSCSQTVEVRTTEGDDEGRGISHIVYRISIADTTSNSLYTAQESHIPHVCNLTRRSHE
jgi:hypothetical protein